MALSITKVNISLDVERVPARLEINSRPPRLELQQKHAKVYIDAELPKVKIDQYQCFAESGLKNYADLTKEMAELANKRALEYIAKLAEDGDMLAAIENGGNPFAEIAERDAFPEKEFGMVTMPRSRPKIDVEGSLTITHDPNEPGRWNWVKGNFIPGDVYINYVPGKLNIQVKQYPSVRIEYLGENVDIRI